MKMNNCTIPPQGWHCTRISGHDGPCAVPSTPEMLEIERLQSSLADLTRERDELRVENEVKEIIMGRIEREHKCAAEFCAVCEHLQSDSQVKEELAARAAVSRQEGA